MMMKNNEFLKKCCHSFVLFFCSFHWHINVQLIPLGVQDLSLCVQYPP